MRRFFKIGGFLAGVIVMLGITQAAWAHGPSHGSMHSSMGHFSSPSGHSHFSYAGNHSPIGKGYAFSKGYGYKGYGYGYGKGSPYFGKNWYRYGRYGYGYDNPWYCTYCPECYGYADVPGYPCPSTVYSEPAPPVGSISSFTPLGAAAPVVSDDAAPGAGIPPASVVIENNASAGGVPPLLARVPAGPQR